MINQGLFTSRRSTWKTPKHVIEELEEEFGVLFDPCPSCEGLREKDMLGSDWKSPAFVNPPYGREIGKWCKKAYEEHKKGKTIIMLVPSRTDTQWWHDYIMEATEIEFIKGRLKFDDQKNPAPFPSAIVIFKDE